MFRLRLTCNIAGMYRETSLRRHHSALLSGGFSFAHSMIEKFSNRKRAAPYIDLQKNVKTRVLALGRLPEFSATLARCTVFLSKKIENCTFICSLACDVPQYLRKEKKLFYLHHYKQ